MVALCWRRGARPWMVFTAAHDGVGARFVVRLAGARRRWRQSVRPRVCHGLSTCKPEASPSACTSVRTFRMPCSSTSSASCRSAGQWHRPDHHGVDAEHLRVYRLRIMRRTAKSPMTASTASAVCLEPAAGRLDDPLPHRLLVPLLCRTRMLLHPAGPRRVSSPRTLFRVRS